MMYLPSVLGFLAFYGVIMGALHWRSNHDEPPYTRSNDDD